MFVGRGRETDRIEELFGQVRSGRSGVLVIEGEAGSGKTSLLDLAARGVEQTSTVLRAAGVAGGEQVAFGGLFSVLRPIAGIVEELPGPQAEALRVVLGERAGTGGDPFLIGVALLGVLATAGERGPVAVLVDDLQWMDPPSARALLFALRRLDADRVGAVLAVRSGETLPGGTAGWLQDMDVVRLHPLDLDDTVRLMSAENIAAPVASELHRLTGGNPLALIETAATLTPAQRRGTAPPPEAAAWPTSAGQVYHRQLEALPAPTRRALVIAAVGRFDDLHLLTAALRAQHLTVADLAAAEDAGLLRLVTDTVPATYVWKHPLVRAAVLDAVEPSGHRAAHTAQTDALTAALDPSTVNPDPLRGAQYRAARAWHRSAATVETDDQVADDLAAVAAEATDRRAHSAAAAAYQRSAALTEDLTARAERLTLAAEAAWRTGDGMMANSLIDTALDHASPSGLVRLFRLKGLYQFEWGPMVAAVAPLEQAFRRALRTDIATALEIAAELVFAAIMGASPETDAIAFECAVLADSHADRTKTRQAALATWTMQYAWYLSFGKSGIRADPVPVADLSRARDEFEQLARRDPRRYAFYAWSTNCVIGDLRRALAQIDPAIATLRANSELSALLPLLQSRDLVTFSLGDWDGAWRIAHEALDVARLAGQAKARRWALETLAVIAALRGQENACLEYVAEQRSPVDVAIGFMPSRGGRPSSLLALGMGHYEQAVSLLEDDYALCESSGRPGAAALQYPDLVEALTLSGRQADAAERARQYVEWMDNATDPGTKQDQFAAVHRVRGLVAADPAEAMAEYDMAVQAHTDNRTDNPFQQARTRLVYGERLRRDGHRRAAREQLRAAAETFERLEAEPWFHRANRELAATGATRRPARRVASSELTGQELRIALLAAEGLSNKEVAARMYLSTKTIEYHLGHVYQKLHLQSRVQLARRFTRPETVGDGTVSAKSPSFDLREKETPVDRTPRPDRGRASRS